LTPDMKQFHSPKTLSTASPWTPRSEDSSVEGEFAASWNEFKTVYESVFQGKETEPQTMRVTYRFCKGLHLDNTSVVRVIIVCVRMLLACAYDSSDLDVVFATALVNLRTPWTGKLTSRMGQQERMLVTLLHVYCAHSMVFDEFVPLSVWHEWLFQSFCSRSTMNVALKKVCLLSNWRFMVQPDILIEALQELRE